MGSTRAMMAMLLVVGLVASVAEGAASPAPAPAADCTSVLASMFTCLDYVTNGSTVAKPDASCCAGLKTVLQQNPLCLCVVLEKSGSFGITLNKTRALLLPSACGLVAPPACPGGGSPVAPPTPTPAPQPSPSPKASPPPPSPEASPPKSSPPAPSQPTPSPISPPPLPASVPEAGSPPSAPPKSAPSPNSPSQEPSSPPESNPRASPPATPPESDNSGANAVTVSSTVVCAVLGLVLVSYH